MSQTQVETCCFVPLPVMFCWEQLEKHPLHKQRDQEPRLRDTSLSWPGSYSTHHCCLSAPNPGGLGVTKHE